MDISEKRYPYPVLKPGGDDYVDSRFDVEVESYCEAEKVTFLFRPILRNDGLRRAIADGEAAIICHVEAPQTVFRQIYEVKVAPCEEASDEERTVYEESSSVLSGPVSVCPFIVAVHDIPAYGNSCFHADYESETFSIQAGGVMAEGSQQTFEINTAKKLEETASSILSVTVAQNEDVKSMRVGWEGNKIRIVLPERMMQLYKQFHESGNQRELLWAMVFSPAVLRVLDELHNAVGENGGGLEDYRDRRWYRALEAATKRLRGYGFDSEDFAEADTVELAEEIIHNALGGALQKMMETASRSIVGEEQE